MEPEGFISLSDFVPKSEPLPEAVTWYIQAARLRTSSFSAPPLNEASFNTICGSTLSITRHTLRSLCTFGNIAILNTVG